MKTGENNENVFNIDVNISEIILTPHACASIVNEILKGLLYQKCQIPYPYSWLKNVVTKKRQKPENEINGRTNFKAESHFRLISNVFDTLEASMANITNEFVNSKKHLKKVVIVLGTTPYTANEVFTITISSLTEGHNERNHHHQLNKYQQKILRNIFLSQDWLDKIDASISCTNIYIYLVKDIMDLDNNSIDNSSAFMPTDSLTFSSKTKHINISLQSDVVPDTNCCENLEVFEDVSGNFDNKDKQATDKDHIENLRWYKYNNLVKGFKDCFVNKKSISELW